MWKLAWGYKHFLPKKNLASNLFEIKEGEIVSPHTLNRLRSVLALGEVRPAGNKKISGKEKIDISAPHRTLGVRCANIFFFFFFVFHLFCFPRLTDFSENREGLLVVLGVSFFGNRFSNNLWDFHLSSLRMRLCGPTYEMGCSLVSFIFIFTVHYCILFLNA